ncbi:MAG: HAD family hydrolase [Cyanobacteria bacterium J06621_8]
MPSSIAIACQNIQFNNILAIVFDKDGTLEDSAAYWQAVAAERARLIEAEVPGVEAQLIMAFGAGKNHFDPQGLMAVGSRYENEIAAAAYITAKDRSWQDSKLIARLAFNKVDKSKYFVKTPQLSPLYQEVKETLQLLAAQGLKLAVLSADSSSAVNAFIINHQLQEYLQLGMGTDGEISKPNPALFWEACKRLEVLPEQTLMVGDSEADMLMGQAAGAAGTIGIVRNPDYPLESAPLKIDSLQAIQIL